MGGLREDLGGFWGFEEGFGGIWGEFGVSGAILGILREDLG